MPMLIGNDGSTRDISLQKKREGKELRGNHGTGNAIIKVQNEFFPPRADSALSAVPAKEQPGDIRR